MFHDMTKDELMDINGGFPWIPLIIAGVLILGCCASCSNSCDNS